jgi:hypothetical protein
MVILKLQSSSCVMAFKGLLGNNYLSHPLQIVQIEGLHL